MIICTIYYYQYNKVGDALMSKNSVELIVEAEERARKLLSDNAEKLRGERDAAYREAEKRKEEAFVMSERALAEHEKNDSEVVGEMMKKAVSAAKAEAEKICADAEKNMDKAVGEVIRGIFLK